MRSVPSLATPGRHGEKDSAEEDSSVVLSIGKIKGMNMNTFNPPPLSLLSVLVLLKYLNSVYARTLPFFSI